MARSIQHLGSRLLSSHSFRVFCMCGLAGVAVDLDHLLEYYFALGPRPLHIPLGIGSGIVLSFALACCAGLYIVHMRRRHS